jgi:hypothetical protein
MIVLASPFFNELDLLEIKCRELAGVVDLFVIVEATTTYTNIPKPLHFAENRARFAEFPIHPVTIEHDPLAKSPWDREWVTQKTILETVRKINPEIALWCDMDELPRRDTVERFRAMNVPTAHVDMDCFLHYFDRMDTAQRPTTAKINRFDRHCQWQPWRGETHHPIIPESGWHFQYMMFGGKEHLLDKLDATCHAIEGSGDGLRAKVQRGVFSDLARTAAYPLNRLPRFVQEQRERFAPYFMPAP